MMVSLKTDGGQFEAGIPKLLCELQLPVPARVRVVGVGNGRRFLVNLAISRSAQGSMTVLLNWPSLLRR